MAKMLIILEGSFERYAFGNNLPLIFGFKDKESSGDGEFNSQLTPVVGNGESHSVFFVF